MNDSTIGNASWWICGRCWTHNPVGAGICQNPMCGGEPVSRTIEARSTTFNRFDRHCFNADTTPKHAFPTFDEAQDQCFATSNRGKRLAVYPCAEHGYHIGSPQRVNAA